MKQIDSGSLIKTTKITRKRRKKKSANGKKLILNCECSETEKKTRKDYKFERKRMNVVKTEKKTRKDYKFER